MGGHDARCTYHRFDLAFFLLENASAELAAHFSPKRYRNPHLPHKPPGHERFVYGDPLVKGDNG